MSIATIDRQEKRPNSLLSDRLYRSSQPDPVGATSQWITMDEPQKWVVPFGPYGKFEFQDKPGEWLVPLVTKICELGFLSENWDSYGARTISLQNAASALSVLLEVVTENTPVPSIVPTCYGGLQAEWHIGGVDLEIEFESPQAISLSFEDADGEEDLDNVEIATIRDRLERLRRRVAGA